MDIRNTIKQLAEDFHSEIISYRRQIHQYPELSFQEYETSKFICSILDQYDIPYQSGFATTGILARITGKNPQKKIIGLRADMDALPITEKNNVDYVSRNQGIMHACGHDVHAASLLGSAKILNQLKEQFEGMVLLLFQPGEEKAPGGARLMLRDGVFTDAEPELILAQHVMPSLPTGTVGFKSGGYMASSDEIYITIKGKGGHAALPHQTTDSVLIASHIVVALQQIVSHHAETSTPTLLSFGKVIANGAVNVIPSEVRIEGTFRTMNETWRKEAHKRMLNIAQSIAESMGGECHFNITEGYPVLYNDPVITEKSKKIAQEYHGADKVKDLEIRMTAEDFAVFSQKYPVTLYRLGVRNPGKDIVAELHTPTFDVDEKALKVGMETMAYLAFRHLRE